MSKLNALCVAYANPCTYGARFAPTKRNKKSRHPEMGCLLFW